MSIILLGKSDWLLSLKLAHVAFLNTQSYIDEVSMAICLPKLLSELPQKLSHI